VKTITLTIEVPSDAGFVESLDGANLSVHADGLDTDTVVGLIVAAAEALTRTDLVQQEVRVNPWADPAHTAESAALASRLKVVDMVMHLPDIEPRGIITEV
jgi:hypothetical protein